MSDTAISKVCVRFTVGMQDTSMTIREADNGTYEVEAVCRTTSGSGFPADELIRRTGRVYPDDVVGLVGSMRTICEPDWFHHYVVPALGTEAVSSSHWSCSEFDGRWSVLIGYGDGACRRWEGFNDAPPTLGGIYDLLVSFGMPSLKLEPYNVVTAFTHWNAVDKLARIRSYIALFAELHPQGEVDETQEDLELLAEEFVDDVKRYVRLCRKDLSSSASLMAWSVVPDLQELEATDVQQAPRAQMLALLDALTQAGDSLQVVTFSLETGMLNRWCERLSTLPKEEFLEQEKRQQEEQERIVQSLDDAIRARIAKKQPFTAKDVAQDVDVTIQRASMRIRSFVRSGTVQTVGNEYPRTYRAA